tara:strand:- start:261 stop:581 length:321 start_codon:yes stop_codon:yes gene_type:complete
MGLAFKENCPDIRNTRVIDIVEKLKEKKATVDVHDPWVNTKEAKAEYGIELVELPKSGQYDAIIIAVSHHQYKEQGVKSIKSFGKKNHVLYDVKYLFKPEESDIRL